MSSGFILPRLTCRFVGVSSNSKTFNRLSSYFTILHDVQDCLEVMSINILFDFIFNVRPKVLSYLILSHYAYAGFTFCPSPTPFFTSAHTEIHMYIYIYTHIFVYIYLYFYLFMVTHILHPSGPSPSPP